MQALPGIIAQLNRTLGRQLVGINQYFLHARMFKNEGLEQLNKHAYKHSILQMK